MVAGDAEIEVAFLGPPVAEPFARQMVVCRRVAPHRRSMGPRRELDGDRHVAGVPFLETERTDGKSVPRSFFAMSGIIAR